MTMSYEERIQTELTLTERLLWQVGPSARTTLGDWLGIPLSLLFGFPFAAAGGVLMAKAIAEPKLSSLFMFLFGIPFLLAGLATIGFPYNDMWQRRRTAFGLTDRRLLVVRGQRIQSLPLHSILSVTLRQHRNGSGTITFITAGAWSGNEASPRPAFDRIADARRVYDLIHDARAARLVSGEGEEPRHSSGQWASALRPPLGEAGTSDRWTTKVVLRRGGAPTSSGIALSEGRTTERRWDLPAVESQVLLGGPTVAEDGALKLTLLELIVRDSLRLVMVNRDNGVLAPGPGGWPTSRSLQAICEVHALAPRRAHGVGVRGASVEKVAEAVF